MKYKQGVAVLWDVVWPALEHCYLICFTHSLSSQSPISDSFLLNPLDLEQKELAF
jgi:hypothetical protein